MKKPLRSFLSLSYLFAAFGILCLPPFVLATVACFSELDVSYGFYRPSGFFTAGAWFAFGFGVLIAIGAFLLTENAKVGAERQITPLTYIPAGLSCAASLFFAFHAFSDGFPALTVMRFLPVLFGLFALGMAVFFLLYIINSERFDTLRVIFGMAGALSLCSYAMFLYFDRTFALNATTEIATEFAFLAAAVFLLFEVRIALDRPIRKLYFSVGFLAAMLTGFISIPALIFYIVSGNLAMNSLFAPVLLFSLFVFILCRMIAVMKLVSHDTESMAKALREAAIVPEKIVKTKEIESNSVESSEVSDAQEIEAKSDVLQNQMGFFDLETANEELENGVKTDAE